jgi:ATP-dependent Lon protease
MRRAWPIPWLPTCRSKLEDKQKVLEIVIRVRAHQFLMAMMESEIDLLQVEKRIRSRVKKQMEKSQREYYLNEQMKAIQKELGELEDEPGRIRSRRMEDRSARPGCRLKPERRWRPSSPSSR